MGDDGRIDIGVGDGENRNIEGVGFANGVFVLNGIDDNDGGWLFGHILDATVALVEEIDFFLKTLNFELGIAIF